MQGNSAAGRIFPNLHALRSIKANAIGIARRESEVQSREESP